MKRSSPTSSAAPLPANHAHSQLTAAQNAAYARISEELRAVQRPRPDWDVDLLQGAFGQPVITTETPDLVMTRGSLADLLQMLASALTQQQ